MTSWVSPGRVRVPSRDINDLLRGLDPKRWTARIAKTGHVRLRHVNGGQVTVPGTPSCKRSLLNTRSLIRRMEAGVLA